MFGGKRGGIGHHQRQITAAAGARHLPRQHTGNRSPLIDKRLDGVLGPGTVFAVQYRIHHRGEHGDLRRERGLSCVRSSESVDGLGGHSLAGAWL